MDLKITQKTEEPMLARTKVEAEVTFEAATPSNADVRAAIAKKMSTTDALVDVQNIYTEFGNKKATITSYAYTDQKVFEDIQKLGKKAIEKIKKAEDDAQKAKEEAAEKKEEPKAEEKPAPAKEEKPADDKEEPAAEEKKEEKPVEPKAEEKAEDKKE